MTVSRLAGGVVLAVSLLPAIVAGQTPAQNAAAQEDEFLKGVYVLRSAPGEKIPGLTAPVVKQSVHPRYTADAMREKLQGTVELQVVVLPDGTVARARVTKSLDKVLGLDEAALFAAKQWTFEPGTLNGEKVPVAVAVILEFRLH